MMKVSYVAYVHRKAATKKVDRDQVYRGFETVHHVLQFTVPYGTPEEDVLREAQERCSKLWQTGYLKSVHRMTDTLPGRVWRAFNGLPFC